jgi:hypothetical protein
LCDQFNHEINVACVLIILLEFSLCGDNIKILNFRIYVDVIPTTLYINTVRRYNRKILPDIKRCIVAIKDKFLAH